MMFPRVTLTRSVRIAELVKVFRAPRGPSSYRAPVQLVIAAPTSNSVPNGSVMLATRP